ncbi:MAG: hypothetical protein RL011_1881 [Pseudomonadota bacterium]|jgi:PmbA protein
MSHKHEADDLAQVASSLERLAEIGLSTAKKLGADAAKISTGASFEKRLVVDNKEFTLANSLASRSIGIVVHKDQKKGSASVNVTNEESIKHAVESALALAKYSVPDPDLVFATKAETPKAKSLDFLFEDKLADLGLDGMTAQMQETLGRLGADPRLALERYEMAVNVSFHALASTTGMAQSERQTMASWSFMGMGRSGDEVTGFDYDGNFAFTADTILPRSLVDADRFVKRVLGLFDPVRCPSYRGAVLLSPRAVQELLLGMMLYHAGGRQVMDGKSRWDKSVGTKVASSLFTLTDLPHDPRFSGATAFDSDGVPTRSQVILEKGVLTKHLHDCYSAKRCHASTTGTAGGPFALSLNGGDTALAEILKSHDQLLMVDRFSGNSDPIKGDFSGVAKSSRLFQRGEDRGSVTETMIAGNFFAIADAVLAVSKEVEIVSGGFASPYVLVDGVSVTGE